MLDASAGPEIVARTALGRRLLALAPRDRAWWVPDHFHVETAGALRRMLLTGLIDEARAPSALDRLLRLPASVARSAPLLTGDREMAGSPNLPVQVLYLAAAN